MIDLQAKAKEIRRIAFEMAVNAKRGHIPPSFSWLDIAVVLYYGGVLKFDAKNPNWPDRDKFILSKGHGSLALYPILSDVGYFNKSLLDTFSSGELTEHPNNKIPGIETYSGSLGHGLGIGVGTALADKLNGSGAYTFVLLGDGECQEGSIWEAASFASERKLNNLITIVDSNKFGATQHFDNSRLLENRFHAFGWSVIHVNGHDSERLKFFLTSVRDIPDKPTVIIADTVKGKGIPFMEGTGWHHESMTEEQIEAAREALA